MPVQKTFSMSFKILPSISALVSEGRIQMMKRTITYLAFAASLCTIVVVSGTVVSTPKLPAYNSHGRLPLIFDANRGQVDGQVKFLSRGNGYTIFFTATENVFSIRKPAPVEPIRAGEERQTTNESSYSLVRMNLLGANPAPRIEGLGELPGKSSYFIGNDPAKWRTDVPQYARIRYRNVYPGVDLIYYGNEHQIEHDFVIAPRADPRQIRFRVTGAERVELDGQGELVIRIAGGVMRQRKPTIYQGEGDARKEIIGGYTLTAGNQVGFELGPYDATTPLVIDPVLVYSTYLGGNGTDRALAPAIDRNGNVYVTGETTSTNFPTNSLQPALGGGLDVFVTKLNASGSAVVYSTYIGGSGDESGIGLAVDDAGNAYVSGRTSSTDFPTPNALQSAYGGGPRDAFVLKLNAAGSALLYSTYLGGSGDDQSFDLRLDSAANAYVSGRTSSTNFPTANALQPTNAGDFDAFVTKLNSTGSALVYSTYLGGSGSDGGLAPLALDSSGNAYVAGSTSSTNFPTVNALQPAYGGGNNDGFVSKLNAAGSALVYSTYLGGNGNDPAAAVAVDPSGNAYVVGRTLSTNFPTINAVQPAMAGTNDGFVSKLNAAGSALIYSTYLGGSGDENIFGNAADAAGNIYLSGWTTSPNFPTANALQSVYGGGATDAFLAKLNPTGSVLVYSTYLGGSGEDRGDYIVVDPAANLYMIGWTSSPDFPTMNPLQPIYGGGSFDTFVAKISEVPASGVFYFAQAGGGGGFSTAIALTNPSTTKSVSGNVSFFGLDGRPLNAVVATAVVPFVIEPSRTAIISTSQEGALIRSGYARVSTSEPVFANATYLLPGLPPLSVRPSLTGSLFAASISRDIAGVDAGIALANISGVTALVNVSLMDSGGSELANSVVMVAPGEQLNRFLSEVIPNIPNKFSGTLQIQVLASPFRPTALLAATVVEFDRGKLREVPWTAVR
jgi:hypothetical protein